MRKCVFVCIIWIVLFSYLFTVKEGYIYFLFYCCLFLVEIFIRINVLGLFRLEDSFLVLVFIMYILEIVGIWRSMVFFNLLMYDF